MKFLILNKLLSEEYTAQKIKFSIKDLPGETLNGKLNFLYSDIKFYRSFSHYISRRFCSETRNWRELVCACFAFNFSKFINDPFKLTPNSAFCLFLIFFNCYLAALWLTWGHCRGGSLTNPMLITASDTCSTRKRVTGNENGLSRTLFRIC